ncbi:MAG TPA: hypothetical protein VHV82_23440 [Sporichthyaceae bacterium]|jgi:hypothetical protein|nr:hypothetical protein [Sporichthyaceae bacterium]
MSGIPAQRGAYEVHDVDRQSLLAGCATFDAAVSEAHQRAWAIASDIEGQLSAHGEGHRGGIPVRVEVRDGGTGERLAAYVAWTAPVVAADARRI